MKTFNLFFCILLFATSIYAQEKKYDIVVAQDGSGNFKTIQEAVTSVRDFRPEGRTVIFIKNGTYTEKLVIPTSKTEITLLGENTEKTIITNNDHANINKMGTFKSYTMLVQGNDFIGKNLTIENNAPELGQAVSLHTEGDRIAFYDCRLLGNQDTFYGGRENTRIFFKDCYIEGTTDFIFGPSTVWFESCTICSKRNSYITAASTPKNIQFGFVFNNCTLTAKEGVTKVYLGRPWRAYGATLFMNCKLGSQILPEGWHNWGNTDNEKTARYAEYKNTGEGANTQNRVPWSKQLTDKEAKEYTIENVFRSWKVAN